MFKTIIFDLGGVLIDWNPEYLYRKLFDDETAMQKFLAEVCTHDWNVQQDAGRPLAEATQILVDRFPGQKDMIEAFYGRWIEMLGGTIDETVKILEEVANSSKYRVLALTNWSGETLPKAKELYPIFHHFEGIVVSGDEKCVKPDPKIYQTLLDRYEVDPYYSIFIDDSPKNVEGAEAFGITGIHFESPEKLRSDLEKLKIL